MVVVVDGGGDRNSWGHGLEVLYERFTKVHILENFEAAIASPI